MPKAAVVSAGMSKIGKRKGLTSRDLFLEAFTECLERARDLSRDDIGAIYVGSQSEVYEHQIMYGNVLAETGGLLPKPAMRVEGCASAGSMALRAAIMDVLAGMHDVVLAVGVEKMSDRSVEEVTEALMSAADLGFEQWNGLTFPSIYAMMAVAHMKKYGSNEKDLALVAVKNHHNATMNPKAHLQKEISVEDVLNSKIVSWPLKLYDSSPISDGAAVAVVTKPEVAKKYTDEPVFILGTGLATDTVGLYTRSDLAWPKAAAISCREAYRMANAEPKDVNMAELHDAFTINEILLCEAAGFTERGKGHILLREGETGIGGKISVNPSGGLKGRGHPTGATGLAQVYEVFMQLRGEAERRQVPNISLALTINEGGSDAAVVSHVFGR
jgi:acetyl-CoA acetyltransferase